MSAIPQRSSRIHWRSHRAIREVRLKDLISPALLALFLTPAIHAQDSNSAASLKANPVYQQNCAKCHGKTAEGRFMGGPSLVSEKTTAMSADDLRTIISNGKHRMPKFSGKLSDADIDSIVSQIKSQKK